MKVPIFVAPGWGRCEAVMPDVAQLLESLHPMREPAPPASVAPYLAMLAFGVAVAAAGFVAWSFARRRRAGLRRSAAEALAATRGLASDERLAAQARLLRRLVRARSGVDASRAQGEAWLTELDRTFDTDAFTNGEGRAYADALYRRDGADAEALDRRLDGLIARLGQAGSRAPAASQGEAARL